MQSGYSIRKGTIEDVERIAQNGIGCSCYANNGGVVAGRDEWQGQPRIWFVWDSLVRFIA